MIRPLAVSAVALCALYLGTAPSEAKWTPNNPNVALPSAARIAAKSMRLPRHVIQENTDFGDDKPAKKKKKKRMIGQSKSAAKKKNSLANIDPGSSNAGLGNQSQQSSLPEVPHIGLPRGLDPTSVF